MRISLDSESADNIVSAVDTKSSGVVTWFADPDVVHTIILVLREVGLHEFVILVDFVNQIQ